jgi:Flp pilus assembly protein TadD
MLTRKLPILLVCSLVVACAQASPEDVQMSLSLAQQGRAMLAAGKNAEARDVYLSAVSRDNDNARAWNGLGVSYDLMGKWDEARDAYQHALTLVPDDMTVANNLAHLYLEGGDAVAAVALLESLVNDPNAPLVLKQNYARATKAVQAAQAKQARKEVESYADLGSYPTSGMAEARVQQIRSLLDDEDVAVVPEVKVAGGTPTFTIKVSTRDPKAVCENMMQQAFPCVPRGE